MKFLTVIMCLSTVIFTIGCSSHSSRDDRVHQVYSSPHESSEKYGRVTDIEVLSRESRTSGGGAILGAVVGGVLGHQVGKGTGRDLATGAGAVGGALAGNNLEKRNTGNDEIYRITVRLENGSRQQFDYEHIDDLRVGDRVKVEDGQLERL